MARPALAPTLIDRILPAPAAAPRAAAVLRVLGGVAFLTLLAQVRVQLGPVPFTGQTLGVLLLGASYGLPLALATTLGYVVLGAVGLPLFSGLHGGLAYIAGPTGGYLVGFVLAAALLGYLAQRGWVRSYGATALAMVLADALVYVPGLLWLHVVLGGGWGATLAAGLLPFLLGDALKLAIAAGLLPTAWRALGRR